MEVVKKHQLKKRKNNKLKKYDLIIIGGGPAGIIAGVTARKYYPKKSILLINNIEKGVIPCGIPYMFSTLKRPEDNAMGNSSLKKNNIDLEINEVLYVNKENKKINLANLKSIKYDKLIFATGSIPIIPPIKGSDKKGVYVIKKEMDYLKKLKSKVKLSKNIVIIGGGFIGVEFADELSKIKNIQISIIELLPSLLGNSFDKEFSELATQELLKKQVKVYTKSKVKEIKGNGGVKSVVLSNGKKIPADLVILGIGSKPNIELAKISGFNTSKFGISTNKYLKTSDKNVFAIGDCSEKHDFFTKQKTSVMLASTATTEARIAGYNLFKKNLRVDNGTIASYSTKIGNLTMASTGFTEKTAKQNGFDVVTGIAESLDKHPGKLPNANMIKVKLIFSRKLKILLGGQIIGPESVGEMINVLSTGIQKKFSITELEDLQFATHPKLTPSPTTYPIIIAAQNAMQKIIK